MSCLPELDPLRKSCEAIFSLYSSLCLHDVSDYGCKRVRMKVPLVPAHILENLLTGIQASFASQPNILEVSQPVTVVGDLNGNIPDLINIVKRFGAPPVASYLFLGNIIGDREFNIETITFVYVMRMIWPSSVLILRGSNEFPEGASCLETEIQNLYGNTDLFRHFILTFSMTPLAASLGKLALFVHGGIDSSITDILSISRIMRPIASSSFQPVAGLLFSNSTENLPMFLPSGRGQSSLFGSQALASFLSVTKFEHLVRGHQFTKGGFSAQFNGTLITVWSCSNKENGGDSIAVAQIEEGRIYPSKFPNCDRIERKDITFIESESTEVFRPIIRSSIRLSRSTIDASRRKSSPTAQRALLGKRNGYVGQEKTASQSHSGIAASLLVLNL